ncbi:MAG: trypsin-like peptidase domain-containing protein [Gammaproteobacteria bacterium]|nr:trypsin-like peptidase domain-containing protein [Gammaproteobacteria bacterium]
MDVSTPAANTNAAPSPGAGSTTPSTSRCSSSTVARARNGASSALAGEDPPTATAGDDEHNHGLFIVQHPGGAPKLVSWQGCGATAAPVDGRAAGSDFAHRCDTLGGSSGSPVVNLDGRVVGLHHYGFADGEVRPAPGARTAPCACGSSRTACRRQRIPAPFITDRNGDAHPAARHRKSFKVAMPGT